MVAVRSLRSRVLKKLRGSLRNVSARLILRAALSW